MIVEWWVIGRDKDDTTSVQIQHICNWICAIDRRERHMTTVQGGLGRYQKRGLSSEAHRCIT